MIGAVQSEYYMDSIIPKDSSLSSSLFTFSRNAKGTWRALK